ncbi:hypothetical protein AX16_006835 [Volvariella volvacea WC 439]|nr:hypothetical protein AX16_006835 [Volvariella volvacea WC 439]
MTRDTVVASHTTARSAVAKKPLYAAHPPIPSTAPAPKPVTSAGRSRSFRGLGVSSSNRKASGSSAQVVPPPPPISSSASSPSLLAASASTPKLSSTSNQHLYSSPKANYSGPLPKRGGAMKLLSSKSLLRGCDPNSSAQHGYGKLNRNCSMPGHVSLDKSKGNNSRSGSGAKGIKVTSITLPPLPTIGSGKLNGHKRSSRRGKADDYGRLGTMGLMNCHTTVSVEDLVVVDIVNVDAPSVGVEVDTSRICVQEVGLTGSASNEKQDFGRSSSRLVVSFS